MTLRTFLEWLQLAARLALELFGGNAEEAEPEASAAPREAGGKAGRRQPNGPPGVPFKPERIQVWVRIVARTILELYRITAEETGKLRGSDSDPPEKVEE